MVARSFAAFRLYQLLRIRGFGPLDHSPLMSAAFAAVGFLFVASSAGFAQQ
jgi:hypothetical protein